MYLKVGSITKIYKSSHRAGDFVALQALSTFPWEEELAARSRSRRNPINYLQEDSIRQ